MKKSPSIKSASNKIFEDIVDDIFNGPHASSGPTEVAPAVEEPVAQENDVHPQFKAQLERLVSSISSANLPFRILQTTRSEAEQQRLYDQGRKNNLAIVTHALPGQSAHQYGLAADFTIVPGMLPPAEKQKRLQVSDSKNPYILGLWNQFGQLAISIGLTWGGNFSNLKDYGHVELSNWRDLVKSKRSASATFNKKASITIQPSESKVQKAVDLVNKEMGGALLANIKTIILETGGDSGGHYGKVESNKPDTIYINFARINSEFGPDENTVVEKLAETIAHEAGHILSKFQGGEGPAEAKEKEFLDKLKQNPPKTSQIKFLAKIANQLDAARNYEAAELVDHILTQEQYVIADDLMAGKIVATVLNEVIASSNAAIRHQLIQTTKAELNSFANYNITKQASLKSSMVRIILRKAAITHRSNFINTILENLAEV